LIIGSQVGGGRLIAPNAGREHGWLGFVLNAKEKKRGNQEVGNANTD